MGQRRKRKPTRKARSSARRRRNTNTKKGGKMPWVIDFKKGFNVTQDMIIALKNTDMAKAKTQYNDMRTAYRNYRARGGKQSGVNFARSKGFITKKANPCCIM